MLTNFNVQFSRQIIITLIRCCSSVSMCILGCLKRNIYSGLPCFYELFPLLCLFENYDSDDDLKSACKRTIAMLAQAKVVPQHIPAVLDSVTKVWGVWKN